jgi:hypothetical protein
MRKVSESAGKKSYKGRRVRYHERQVVLRLPDAVFRSIFVRFSVWLIPAEMPERAGFWRG